jgi:hypothetical protein
LKSDRSSDLEEEKGSSESFEFDGFRKLAGLNSFTLTPKQWIDKTNAIGLVSKPGRYGVG